MFINRKIQYNKDAYYPQTELQIQCDPKQQLDFLLSFLPLPSPPLLSPLLAFLPSFSFQTNMKTDTRKARIYLKKKKLRWQDLFYRLRFILMIPQLRQLNIVSRLDTHTNRIESPEIDTRKCTFVLYGKILFQNRNIICHKDSSHNLHYCFNCKYANQCTPAET